MSVRRTLATIWAIGGFSALMLWAIYRLALITLEALQMPFGYTAWVLLIGNVLFMAWSEGYRGFQLGYSPRFARRTRQLLDSGTAPQRWLAPLFAMGYFDADKQRLITTYVLTAAIIGLILLFHQIPQPWRGILDAGVVVGLTWGLLATWWHCYLALISKPSPTACEV